MTYQRRNREEARACKFCGMAGLRWTEVSPDKFRLTEPAGGVHDCRQFHDTKRAAGPHAPGHRVEGVERGSLLRQLNNWAQKWGNAMPMQAREELDEMIDEAAAR